MPGNELKEKKRRRYSFRMNWGSEVIDKKLNGSINTHATSICKNPNVAKHLFYLHHKYGVVPADEASTTSFVCVNLIT